MTTEYSHCVTLYAEDRYTVKLAKKSLLEVFKNALKEECLEKPIMLVDARNKSSEKAFELELELNVEKSEELEGESQVSKDFNIALELGGKIAVHLDNSKMLATSYFDRKKSKEWGKGSTRLLILKKPEPLKA